MHILIAYWPYITAATMFASFIGCLIGHARASQQAEVLAADCKERYTAERELLLKEHRNMAEGVQIWRKDAEAYKKTIEALEDALCAESKELQSHKDFIESLREQNRELEHRCDTAIRGHKDAAPFMREVQDALVCSHLSTDGTPLEQLARLIAWECSVALDPAVSKQAKNLITKGVRKANKLNRVRMAKVLAEHELKVGTLTLEADSYKRAAFNHFTELEMHRKALQATMKDKLALPGVRKSFHKAFVAEMTRLRTQGV